MNDFNSSKSSLKNLASRQRKSINLSQGELVKLYYLSSKELLPLVISPVMTDTVYLVDWAKGNKEFVEKKILEKGAILFRGFSVEDSYEFEKFALALCSDLLTENGEHTRENISGRVYTPVFYPAENKILWHNENSFNHSWPRKIMFCCRQTPNQGGETPIVDSCKVYDLMSPEIREQFEHKNIMYVRNYGNNLGLSWQQVFQTADKAVVEEHCKQAYINFEWKDGDRLKTRSVRPAIIRDPKTGKKSWFNQAQHWHTFCLDIKTRESVLSLFSEEDLPRNCYYGDGSPIPDSFMAEICQVYQNLEISFSWQKDDILLLDNVLTAHARNPYIGERNLLVAMGEITQFFG